MIDLTEEKKKIAHHRLEPGTSGAQNEALTTAPQCTYMHIMVSGHHRYLLIGGVNRNSTNTNFRTLHAHVKNSH